MDQHELPQTNFEPEPATATGIPQHDKAKRTWLVIMGAFLAPLLAVPVLSALESVHMLPRALAFPVIVPVFLLPSYCILLFAKLPIAHRVFAAIGVTVLWGLFWNLLLLYYIHASCFLFHNC